MHLYFQEEGKAIISEDRTFLNLFDRNNRKSASEEVPFITPANAMVTMANKGIILNEEARRELKQIKEIALCSLSSLQAVGFYGCPLKQAISKNHVVMEPPVNVGGARSDSPSQQAGGYSRYFL